MAAALGIAEYTLETLANLGVIPHTYVQLEGATAQSLRFNPYLLADYFRANPALNNITQQPHIDGLKAHYQELFPGVINTLKTLDAQIAPRRIGKGYNLTKVPSKRYGFLYYVRYIVKGKLVLSRWNTRTNNREIAEHFAVENRERILAEYYAKRQFDHKVYDTLEHYYEKDSSYLAAAKLRGQDFTEKARKSSEAFIKKVFIPFLRKQRVHTADDITPPVITRLQGEMLTQGRNSWTVNRLMGIARAVFDYMVMDGLIIENPLRKAAALKTRASESKLRGCYEINTLKGVFNTRWQDTEAQLLCLIIYATGLRNSEIERIRLQDIIMIKKIRFINIYESKSENGVRLIPLHDFVYDKLTAYAKKKKRAPDEQIFQFGISYGNKLYIKANAELGRKLGYDKDALAAQNITFYSGRHFWKTLLNAHELGDVEEYFMGHKLSNDVAKRYNHRDKQGQQRIVAKAREVIKMLDKALFRA